MWNNCKQPLKSHTWKSAGIEQDLNYCLNSLHKGNYILASFLSDARLSEVIIYLLPKTNNTVNPKNHRPITCLSTAYKLRT